MRAQKPGKAVIDCRNVQLAGGRGTQKGVNLVQRLWSGRVRSHINQPQYATGLASSGRVPVYVYDPVVLEHYLVFRCRAQLRASLKAYQIATSLPPETKS